MMLQNGEWWLMTQNAWWCLRSINSGSSWLMIFNHCPLHWMVLLMVGDNDQSKQRAMVKCVWAKYWWVANYGSSEPMLMMVNSPLFWKSMLWSSPDWRLASPQVVSTSATGHIGSAGSIGVRNCWQKREIRVGESTGEAPASYKFQAKTWCVDDLWSILDIDI